MLKGQGQSKEYEIFDSNKNISYSIKNLANFCRENNLSEICMRDVSKGRSMQHKGFYCKDKTSDINLLEIHKNRLFLLEPRIKITKTKKERYNQSDLYYDFLNNVEKYYNDLHIDKKLSCQKIAELLGSNDESIRLAFKKLNLELKNYKYNSGKKNYEIKNFTEKQKLLADNFQEIFNKEHFDNKLSINSIAKKYEFTPMTIFNYCKKYEIKYESKNISSPHSAIINILDNYNINYEKNNRILIKPQELDIYIPDYNFAIEINSLYWHSEDKKEKNYHLNKFDICKEKNILLLQFWDIEIDNKADLVESMILSKLGIYKKIMARKCEIKILNNNDIKEFENKNHIQGYRSSSINYGLFYKNELVMVMTFNKHNQYDFEIIRLCSKSNHTILGGSERLFKKFISDYNPNSILSFCDKRLFNGNVYKKLGFKLERETSPNYWYFNDREYILKSRLQFQKHKLSKLENFDPNKSESENMRNNRYYKIYDCGNYVFIWRKNT
jgi:hypothetical protein